MRNLPRNSVYVSILLLSLLGSSCQADFPETAHTLTITTPVNTELPLKTGNQLTPASLELSPTSTPDIAQTDTPAPNPDSSSQLETDSGSGIKGTAQIIHSATPELGETRLREKDQGTMLYVTAGQFEMGIKDEQIKYVLTLCQEYNQDCNYEVSSELSRPTHRVALHGYWIDQYEITNAQFAAFLNDQGNQIESGASWLSIDNPHSLIKLANDSFQPKEGFAEHPVIEVTWYGATAYCEWAGGRLPTEAEWEYAARGPESLIFPWGNTFDLTRLNFCDTNCEKFWKTEDYDTGYSDGFPMTAPVGSYPDGASWCGSMDMAGNVWEWVADWMGPYNIFPQTDPTGPESGTIKVIKGGAWCNAPTVFVSSYRWNYAPLGSGFNLGFRCVVP